MLKLKEIKEYLKIDKSEEKFDTILDMLNDHITASIRLWLGRDITLGTYNEIFDIDFRQQSIFLRQYPVVEIIKIECSGENLKENEDYYLYSNTGAVKIVNFEGLKVEIAYQAGYEEIPEPIKQAALKLIYREFYDRGVDDIKHMTVGSYSHTRDNLLDGMPMGVYTLLHPYRRQFR